MGNVIRYCALNKELGRMIAIREMAVAMQIKFHGSS
tara:strand:- start:223 stop:330 length:108 start_codon:yes stop_codon:yes gene_type:complete